MSVFTPLARPELEAFLAPYDLGRLRDFQGIAAGTENSNFFISLEKGEFVLTLVERGPVQDLPFFIELLDVLQFSCAGLQRVQRPISMTSNTMTTSTMTIVRTLMPAARRPRRHRPHAAPAARRPDRRRADRRRAERLAR